MNFLNEYTLLGELGKGGFATVYKVRHNDLGYVRAVRVLNEYIINETCKTYRNFIRECRTLLRLGNGSHPNIVHIYQPRFIESHALVEMDFVDGTTISNYLKDNKNFLPINDILCLIKDISSALAYCHEDIYKFCMDKNEDNLKDDPNDGSKVLMDDATRDLLIEKYKVIHNDIHSGNIMRCEDGRYILLDFGLAIEGDEVVNGSSRHDNGAPEYKAPEKWDDSALLTERSDIYSFGIVMYEYLAGRVPFILNKKCSNKTEAKYQLSKAQKKEMPPSIANLRKYYYEAKYPGKSYVKDYPDWLEEAILKCLEKDPDKRFKNGKELYNFVKENSDKDIKKTDETEIMTKLKNLAIQSQSIKDSLDIFAEKLLACLNQNNEINKRLNAIEDSLNQKIFTSQPSNMSAVKKNKSTSASTPEVIKNANDEIIIVDGVELDMVLVKGGTFAMGSTITQDKNCNDNESPIHNVTLSDFYISKFEVTQKLWEAVMGTTIKQQRDMANPSWPLNGEGDNYPMYYVNWHDCKSFIKKLNNITGRNFRLPTEAEWEYAARGGNKSQGNKYSGSNIIDKVAWYCDNSEDSTHPVGTTNSANELGIYDMSGNLYEWCEDWYNSYIEESQTNPTGPISGIEHVLRGGSWYTNPDKCRVSHRSSNHPNSKSSSHGFRLVISK